MPGEELQSIIRIFVTQTKGILETLKRLGGEIVFAKIEKAPRTTMMAAGLFGAREVRDLSTKLQLACRAEDEEEVRELVPSFIVALSAAG
jgi:hypothetical protein